MTYQLPTDFKRITFQDIFNAAWQAFIVENRPPGVETSKSGFTSCCYLTEDGRKCAVGLVIPDGHPVQSYSGPFEDIVGMHPELWHDSILDCDSLAHFQTDLHDGLTFISMSTEPRWNFSLEERKKRYLEVAQYYGLTVPEPRTPDPGHSGGGRSVSTMTDHEKLVEALDLALEYWRDRQQRYKNRRPKWVIAAESALAAYRKGGE